MGIESKQRCAAGIGLLRHEDTDVRRPTREVWRFRTGCSHCPILGRSHLTAAVQLGVTDCLDDTMRGNDVAIDDGGSEAIDDGA
jgi:hypothetical protein